MVVAAAAAAAVVVVVDVTTGEAEEIVFMTEFILVDWPDNVDLDKELSVLEASVSMTPLVLAGPTRAPCWTKAKTLVPFWAMLATI